jgi:hypothetical protein
MTSNVQGDNAFELISALKKLKPEDAVRLPEIASRLSLEQRLELLEFLENERETPLEREMHEPRMQAVFADAAKVSGLQWSSNGPIDHPFGARLDGVLLHNRRRVAVVELETKNRKQIDGSLLDLVTHQNGRRFLSLAGQKKFRSQAD